MTEKDKKFLIRSVIAFVVFIGFIWAMDFVVSKANAADQSQPQEWIEVVPNREAPVESPYYRPGIYPQLRFYELEEQYLKLKVDWDEKHDIELKAAVDCGKFTGDKKVKCYIGNSYFSKKQISEKSLIEFVDFKQKYKVY